MLYEEVKGADCVCEDSFTLAPLLKVFENITYYIHRDREGCKGARGQPCKETVDVWFAPFLRASSIVSDCDRIIKEV